MSESMQPRVFGSVAEVRSAVGTHLGYSRWHVIDQERIDAFADVTEDHQWIHTDPERARRGPFGSTIAHGYLSLSLVSVMLSEVVHIDGLAMQINYGSNKVRYPAPLPVGSRVRGGVDLLSLEPQAQGFQLVQRVTITAEHGEKPVCVAEILGYLVPQP